MKSFLPTLIAFLACAFASAATAADVADAAAAPDGYDAALAQRLGADARGMRPYVLVILKTGPKRMPDGEARKKMFAGHFANIQRLADEGKLAVAGPFEDDAGGWRGLFLFAVADIEEAKRLTAGDPVIASGEMTAEYHAWYGSAAVMIVPETHKRITPAAAK
jgi:uncharacterized protein YciI